MKNTLSDLNNYLFEQLERLSDDSLSSEAMELQLKRTDSVVRVADKIIQNGELAFKTMQHLDQYGYGNAHRSAPTLLSYESEASSSEEQS